MTYQIPIEALLCPRHVFARLVEARIATLREYDAHEAIVRAHALVADMPDQERYVHLAVPEAPFAEVDSAIRRTGRPDGTSEFVADYEIVMPTVSFEAKKAKLLQQVSDAESAAQLAVVAPGKIRAFQFREADIRKADNARAAARAQGTPDPGRPEADTRFLDEQAAREDQRNEIARWAAQLHSDIEDLTPDTIDAWQMKAFR